MNQSISTLVDLLTRREFRFGISLGSIGLMVLFAHRGLTRRHNGWGVVLAFLVVGGIQAEIGWQPELMAGMTVMGIGGWLRQSKRPATRNRPGWCSVVAWLLIVTGAGVISVATEISNSQYVPMTVLAAIGIGWSFSKWTEGHDRRALGPLFAITAFGIWTTVPETGLARLLLGISIPMALTTIPPLAIRSTGAGGFALGGIVAWLAVQGGDPASGSVIGAWACVGIIAILPIASRYRIGRDPATWQTVGLHVVAVIAAARVIGRWERATFAAIGSVLLAAALLGAISLIDREPTSCE